MVNVTAICRLYLLHVVFTLSWKCCQTSQNIRWSENLNYFRFSQLKMELIDLLHRNFKTIEHVYSYIPSREFLLRVFRLRTQLLLYQKKHYFYIYSRKDMIPDIIKLYSSNLGTSLNCHEIDAFAYNIHIRTCWFNPQCRSMLINNSENDPNVDR